MRDTPHILLVDDQEENLVALEALLRRDDAVLLRAHSGAEALEALLVHDVALAIVDVQMPEMDGIELAELMRGTVRTREVPIMFVTAGLHDQARIFRGYETGAVDFLHKPLDPLILRSKVEVFLQLHRQRQLLAGQLDELRRADRGLREADRRKDEFLALLSHELRNPLSPIENSLYILERAAPGSEQAHRALGVISRQSKHMARLVNDLLDVTRIARGKVQLKRGQLDLSEALRRTSDDHRAGFAAKGVALRIATPPDPVLIDGDATRIAQAVGNLLVNALKFTPPGGSVTLSLDADADADHAVVRVSDDGVGIARELLGHIFEPFTQGDRTLDRSQGGLGLGLALVKGMVELHGGVVSAASAGPGQGATFTVRLPVAPKRRVTARALATNGVARRRRVLVVEDNADAADSLREALEILGHEVHVAGDGSQAIAVAQRIAPEVVVCDIGLPGMDGYEVARQLRKLERTPLLVALTGYALPEDRRRSAAAGFAHHLAKPLSIEDLSRVLSEG
jgi:signal transduction histidine kinase